MSSEAPEPKKEPSLARFSVSQPVLVNLVAIAMMLTGALVFSMMTREVYPAVPIGAAAITTIMPGASAEEVEQLVTAPLEDELADIDDVERIESNSRDGRSFIWVQFEAEVTDTGRKVLEVTNEVNRVDLPAAAQTPLVREAAVRPPAMAVSVRGEAPEAVLRSVARDLQDRLERVEGVAAANATGIREREIHVDVDPDRLAAFRVPLSMVAGSLASRGSNVPAGQMDTGRRSRIVRGMAQTSSAEQIGSVVVRPDAAGGSVRVSDVADIRDGYERARTLARIDGEPAIVFILLKDDGADALQISADVRSILEEMQPDVPPGVTLSVFGDTAHYVESNLNTLYANAAVGLTLVLLILWAFVGLRNGLMAALGIPVAVAGGLVVMHLLGITINLLSLLALILSLGVIVDDAIIIIENVFRHVESGMPRREAAVVGTMEVFWPVVASTATTCSAFLPLLLMTGVLGEFFAIIPKVIVAALVASLIEAFFVLPSHLADFGETHDKHTKERTPGFVARVGKKVEARFTKVLRAALKRRILVVGGTYLLCIGLIAAAVLVKSVTLFSEGDVELFDVRVRMPTDAAPEETDRVLGEIERRILALENSDVEAVLNIRGYSRTRTWDALGDHVGMVTVYMVPRGVRSSQDAGTRMLGDVSGLFDDLVGPASLEVVKFEDGPPKGAPVAVRIMGDDLDELAELSEQVQTVLRQVEGTRDVGDDFELGKQELQVRVDEDRAALHGMTNQGVTSWLATAFGALPVATTRDGDEEVDILVRLREDAREDPVRLAELNLVTPAGQTVALREVATLRPGRGLSTIRRRNRHRAITVTCDLVEGSGITSSDVNRELEDRLADLMAANPDVRFELGGEFEETQKSLDSLFLAFLVAALLIYTILATQFRSFMQPLIVMTAIPLSLIGVSIGFLVSGEAVGMIGLIGVVGLAGIVVNDSLVLVDFINKRRDAGLAIDDAIVEAARLRLRPIFLTSVTTIAGLFPLAVGFGGRSELLGPMATAIAWGLTFSTVLILVIVPCLYRTVDGMGGAMRRAAGPLIRFATGEARPSAPPAGAEPAE